MKSLNIYFLLLSLFVGFSSCSEMIEPTTNSIVKLDTSSVQVFFIATVPDTTQPLSVLLKPVITTKLESTWKLIWDFGDSSNRVEKHDTIPIVHTYSYRDSFIVTLVLLDTISKDSIYIKDTINLGALTIQPKTDLSTLSLAFTYTIPASSSPLSIQFIPTLSTKLENSWKLIWDFGDLTPTVSQYDLMLITHNYSSHDYYTVKLILKDIATNDSIFVTKNVNLRLPVQVDSNLLHQFTKVQVLLKGRYDYQDNTPPTSRGTVKDSGIILVSTVVPDSISHTEWVSTIFDASSYSSKYQNDQYGYVDRFDKRAIRLFFSKDFSQIDSVNCNYEWKSEEKYKWTNSNQRIIQTLSCIDIPFSYSKADTAVYEFKGRQIQTMAYNILRNRYTEGYIIQWLTKIYWENEYTPTLTIKLFN